MDRWPWELQAANKRFLRAQNRLSQSDGNRFCRSQDLLMHDPWDGPRHFVQYAERSGWVDAVVRINKVRYYGTGDRPRYPRSDPGGMMLLDSLR